MSLRRSLPAFSPRAYRRPLPPRARRQAISRACIEALENRRLLNFAPAVSYSTGTSPQEVVTADFNNDGKLDLATANAGSNNVSVRLGNGAGGFGAVSHFATGAAPQCIAVGDFNNDGTLDVATGNNRGQSVSVLVGNGNGTFQPRVDTALPAHEPLSLAVGDFDRDGKIDLAMGSEYDFYGYGYGHYKVVAVLLGNGQGDLRLFGWWNVGAPPSDLAVADVTQDGLEDIIAVRDYDDEGVGALALLRGISSYPFLDWTNSPTTGSRAKAVAVGNFNGDGVPDLVTAGKTVDVLLGTGGGSFAPPSGNAANGNRHTDVAAADFNADGKLDTVISDTTTGTVSVLLGDGAGNVVQARAFATGVLPSGVAVGDFNGDGRADVAVANEASNTLSVLLNDGGPWPTQTITPALRISDAPVTEGNSGAVNAVFTVTLENGPASANVTVNYSTADGTATVAGGDYTAMSGTLTFTPGQTSKTITIAVKGDRIGEEVESFYLGLAGAANADVLDGSGVGTILDDEPRVSFDGLYPHVTEGDSGTTPAVFTVNLSAASDAPVTVDFSTASGNPGFGYGGAISGKDFDATSGTLTFQPGQTSKTITVAVRGDLVDEEEEYFDVILSNANNAVIEYFGGGVGWISDDDPAPSIVVSDVSRAEGNSGTTPFTFTISLTAASEKPVSVTYATAAGTASNSGGNIDYQSKSGTLNFAPGQTTQTVTVSVAGDTRNESDETFSVNLSSPINGTIADGQGVGTILNDESRGKTWVGPASGGSWSTASNWSPNGVPTADSLVTISAASVTLPASARVSELTLKSGAALAVAPAGNRVLRTAGLFLDDAAATLNLNDNDMILDHASPAGASASGSWNGLAYDGVTGLIARGYNFSAWDGGGLVTTTADARAGLATLAPAEAADVLNLSGSQTAVWNGQTVDATTVLVKYTYAGDVDLNGYVDAADYGVIDNWIQFPGTWGYANGDFNYDGVIDAADYGIIDNSIQLQGSPL